MVLSVLYVNRNLHLCLLAGGDISDISRNHKICDTVTSIVFLIYRFGYEASAVP